MNGAFIHSIRSLNFQCGMKYEPATNRSRLTANEMKLQKLVNLFLYLRRYLEVLTGYF